MPTTDPSSWPAGAAPAPEFCAEDARAAVLAAYGTEAIEPAGDRELSEIAAFAARLCNAPVSFVTLVLSESQQFVGRAGSDMAEPPKSSSFCTHSLGGGDLFIVTDAAQDPRFADNSLVTGEPNIRFYAGAPLISPEGAPLGALCVMDTAPRQVGLTGLQSEGLHVLARAAMRRLNALRQRRAAAEHQSESSRAMRQIADLIPSIIWSADGAGQFDYFNRQWVEVTGKPRPQALVDWRPVVHEEDADRVLEAWTRCFGTGKAFQSEYRLSQADGTWRWTLARGCLGPTRMAR